MQKQSFLFSWDSKWLLCDKGLLNIADLFRRSDTKYALRNKEFVIPRFNTATYGKHSIRYTGPRLWNIVPKNIRELPTLSSFKINIRKIDLNTLLTDNHCTNCILCST